MREWLLTLRPVGLPWYSVHSEEATGQKSAKPVSDKTIKFEAELERFHQRLIVNSENPTLNPELVQLVDSLLDFYRRSAKPAWWALFERQDAEYEVLIDDLEVIAGLNSPQQIAENVYRYAYPEQEFKIKEGTNVTRLDNIREVSVIKIDEDLCTVDLKIRIGKDEVVVPQELSVSMGKPLPTNAMQNALFAFADSLIKGEQRYKSIQDYLTHKAPDIRGIDSGQRIISEGFDAVQGTIKAVQNLNSSYLFIQGPPGTGKTYTGSHLIARLLQDGKRIAISSNSHKAINNLLHAEDERMEEAGATYFGLKKYQKRKMQ